VHPAGCSDATILTRARLAKAAAESAWRTSSGLVPFLIPVRIICNPKTAASPALIAKLASALCASAFQFRRRSGVARTGVLARSLSRGSPRVLGGSAAFLARAFGSLVPGTGITPSSS
jgi:hypothetical protein